MESLGRAFTEKIPSLVVQEDVGSNPVAFDETIIACSTFS